MSNIAPISMKVATTLSAYRIVTALTGTADSVKYPAATSEVCIGITSNDVLDVTNSIPVEIGGFANLYFNDTVASGAFVASDSSGRGVPHVNVTAGSYVIGILIGPAVAATGTIAKVLIQPMFKSIP